MKTPVKQKKTTGIMAIAKERAEAKKAATKGAVKGAVQGAVKGAVKGAKEMAPAMQKYGAAKGKPAAKMKKC